MSRQRLGLAVLVAATTGGGCSDTDPLAPPAVFFGEDVCALCGMIISDERFAAASIVTTDRGYVPRLFDDLGCLLRDDAESPDAAVARYVRDVRADRWLPLDTARFLHSRELRTPMASGVAATATTEDARALLAEYPGAMIDLAELRRRYAAEELGVMEGQAFRSPGG